MNVPNVPVALSSKKCQRCHGNGYYCRPGGERKICGCQKLVMLHQMWTDMGSPRTTEDAEMVAKKTAGSLPGIIVTRDVWEA